MIYVNSVKNFLQLDISIKIWMHFKKKMTQKMTWYEIEKQFDDEN